MSTSIGPGTGNQDLLDVTFCSFELLVLMKELPCLQSQKHKDQKEWISLAFLFPPSLLVPPDTLGQVQGGTCLLGILEP